VTTLHQFAPREVARKSTPREGRGRHVLEPLERLLTGDALDGRAVARFGARDCDASTGKRSHKPPSDRRQGRARLHDDGPLGTVGVQTRTDLVALRPDPDVSIYVHPSPPSPTRPLGPG